MRLVTSLTVAGMLVAIGCAPHAATDQASVPPVAHLDPARVHTEAPAAPPAPAALVEDDPHDPVATAGAAVAASLYAEGLEIVDLTAQLIDIDDTGATVSVAVVHGTGVGHPHQSAYQVELHHSADGWRIRRMVQTP